MSAARLFYALWPEAGLRQQIAAWSATLAWPAGAEPVPPANYHLTLRYLGAVPVTALPGLEALGAAAAAEAQPLSLRLATVEAWERPRVLVLGVSPVPAPLVALAMTLEAGVQRLGHPPETRPLRPHLTLARQVRVAPAPLPSVALDWTATTLVLCESVAGAYPVRAAWTFGPRSRGAPVE